MDSVFRKRATDCIRERRKYVIHTWTLETHIHCITRGNASWLLFHIVAYQHSSERIASSMRVNNTLPHKIMTATLWESVTQVESRLVSPTLFGSLDLEAALLQGFLVLLLPRQLVLEYHRHGVLDTLEWLVHGDRLQETDLLSEVGAGPAALAQPLLRDKRGDGTWREICDWKIFKNVKIAWRKNAQDESTSSVLCREGVHDVMIFLIWKCSVKWIFGDAVYKVSIPTLTQLTFVKV